MKRNRACTTSSIAAGCCGGHGTAKRRETAAERDERIVASVAPWGPTWRGVWITPRFTPLESCHTSAEACEAAARILNRIARKGRK